MNRVTAPGAANSTARPFFACSQMMRQLAKQSRYVVLHCGGRRALVVNSRAEIVRPINWQSRTITDNAINNPMRPRCDRY